MIFWSQPRSGETFSSHSNFEFCFRFEDPTDLLPKFGAEIFVCLSVVKIKTNSKNLGWRVTFTWKSATVKKQSQKFDLRRLLRQGREHSHFSVGHTCRSVKSAYRLLIRLPTFQDLSRTFTLRHISTTNGVFRVILLDFILTQFGYGDGLEIIETPFAFGQSDEKVT